MGEILLTVDGDEGRARTRVETTGTHRKVPVWDVDDE